MALSTFPNLYSHRQISPSSHSAFAEFFTDSCLPKEIILLSWGILLESYTNQESLKFIAEDELVTVDSEHWIIRYDQASQVRSTLDSTAVYYELSMQQPDHLGSPSTDGSDKTLSTNPSSRCSSPSLSDSSSSTTIQSSNSSAGNIHTKIPGLSLRYDAQRKRGILRSLGTSIPHEHLPELAKQYVRATQIATKGQKSNIQNVSDPDLHLSILNPFPSLLKGPTLLHELILQNGQDSALAVDFLDADGQQRHITYAELHRRADVVAIRLSRMYQKRDLLSKNRIVVPVLLPQSPELYIVFLGILKSGAAFCPLSLDMPVERLKFILTDVSADVLVTNDTHKNMMPASCNIDLCIIDYPNLASNECGQLCFRRPFPKNIAYVIYTSGSSGQPKGVLLSHLSVTQSLLAHDSTIPPFKRFLQFASPTFDVSMFEIFFTLFRGSTLVACDRNRMLDDLPEIMNKMKVDAAELTPTVAGSLLRRKDAVPTLQLLLTIGEMLNKQVIQEFGASPDKEGVLYGMYGPTEAAIHCTLSPVMDVTANVGLIGRPLGTTSAFIVGPNSDPAKPSDMRILPIGQAGELVVGGHQLASEYLNRTEQTNTAFVNHPQYGRLYRTGDRARMLPDRNIECLGRIEAGQVKLRGQRVELGEIEQAASRADGCRLVSASILNGSVLLFCLVDSSTCTEKKIMETCTEWLPAFMLPNRIFLRDHFPRLPSGKVDKEALESSVSHDDTSQTISNGQDEDEQTARIATIAARILGSHVSVNQELSRIGLDSLSAIRFASELRTEGFDISSVDILKAKNISALCNMIEVSKENHKTDNRDIQDFTRIKEAVLDLPMLKDRTLEIAHVFPCTPLQVSMLVETLRNPQAYCNWVLFEFGSEFTIENCKSALHTVFQRSEILRSGFVLADDASSGFAQLVWHDFRDEYIEIVQNLDYDFRVTNMEALLRPMRIQVFKDTSHVKALLHIHHALYDGWSLDLLLYDLQCSLNGQTMLVRPQFSEVIEYLSSSTIVGEEDIARDYWEERMRDFHPRPLPNMTGLKLGSSELSTTQLSMGNLHRQPSLDSPPTCHRQVYFQAALSLLMSFYLGTDDVVLGTVTSGRTIPITNIENIVGPCIATLPLRTNVTKSRTVGQLLHDVHDAGRQLLQYGTLPLREINRIANLEPGKSVFDVLFIWQESLASATTRCAAVRVLDTADFLEFGMVIEVEPNENGITVKARYRSSLFPKEQADLFLQQLGEVVRLMQASPEKKVGEIVHSMPGSLLSIENPKPRTQSTNKSIVTYVEDICKRCPNKLAISIAGWSVEHSFMEVESITYGELNIKSNQLAHYLLEQGVQPDDLVCVLMEKSVDLYVTILAILKTGAGYLPLTPETPAIRVQTILTDAQVRLCLSWSAAPEFVHSMRTVTVSYMDKLQISKFSGLNPSLPYEGKHLAYAVFTSGSTGSPKGVLVTQKNLVSNVETLWKLYPVSANSRLLQSCSPAFDVSAWEIFFSFATGMCLCATPNDVLFRDLEGAIRYFQISHLSLTPTVAALVNPENIPTVSFLVTSGEAVTEPVFQIWAGKGLWQGYGPSETTNICTVNPNVTHDHTLSNIGPPLENTSAFVLSKGNNFGLVPRGGIGELCFGGEQVFRGYLNMHELTSEKVYLHPEYGRVYRSGDLGRIMHDGTILFHGRVDDQIKIRGQRVELGEINSLVIKNPNVQDCATIVTTRRDPHEKLITFWVPKGRKTIDTTVLTVTNDIDVVVHELITNLTGSLPSYMVPTFFIPVSKLPATVQAKLDKRKLESMYEQLETESLELVGHGSEYADDHTQWNEEEHSIATALAKITGAPINNIRRRASFFTLGLDSVSAIKMSNVLRSEDRMEASVSTILRHSNVAALASAISAGRRWSKPPVHNSQQQLTEETMRAIQQTFPAKGINVENVRPCTPLQEAILAATSSSSESYYNHTVFKIKGSVDRVRNSFDYMCERHQILRTCFVTTEFRHLGYAQVVLTQHDLAWNSKKVVEVEVDDHVSQAIASTIPAVDTFKPPVSVSEFITDSGSLLVLSMHHSLYDGEAVAQLLWEIEQYYLDQSLPEVVSFDAVLDDIHRSNHERADVYWERLLKDYAPVDFPHLNAWKEEIHENTSVNITVHAVDISLSELEQSSRQHATTLLSICQAAWAKVLSVFLEENDVCFGNVVSGRTLPIQGIERLVAPCFNTIPLRIIVTPSTTNEQLIGKIQRININSLEHQFSPLRRIQSRWNSEGAKLFDTLFIMQQPLRQLDGRIWQLLYEVGGMGFPIVCELTPVRDLDRLQLTLHVRNSLIPQHDVHHLAKAFNVALSSCAKYPQEAQKNFGPPEVKHFVCQARDHLVVGKAEFSLYNLAKMIREKDSCIQDAAVVHRRKSTSDPQLLLIILSLRPEVSTDMRAAIIDAAISVVEKTLKAYVRCHAIVIDYDILLPAGLKSRKFQQQILLDYERSIIKENADFDKMREYTNEEIEVRGVLSEFSGVPVEKITSDRTIFSLGLDSINAIQIAKALRNKKLDVSGTDIMQNPTSAGIAKIAKHKSNVQERESDIFDFLAFDQMYRSILCKCNNICEDYVQSVRPCTALQAGMIAQFLHSGGKTYFNHTIYELHEGINAERLREAWKIVVSKHEMLRTGFASLDKADFPFAMITYTSRSSQVPWVETEASGGIISTLTDQREALAKDVEQNFHGPPWRLSICKDHKSFSMQFSGHHALYDADSLVMILDDVRLAYNDEVVGKALTINPLLSTILDAANHTKSKQFWKGVLEDVAVNKFPVLTPLRVVHRTVQSCRAVSSKSRNQIEADCRRLDITLQAALQATWVQLLTTYTGEDEATFGLVLAGRDSKEAEGVAFPTTTTVPCRCRLRGSNRELLDDIMKFNSTVRNHQHVPLTQIQRWAGQSKTALFDTILVLQKPDHSMDGNKFWRLADEEATVEYAISLEVAPSIDDKMIFRIVFWEDVLPIEHAKILLEQFDALLVDTLDQISSDPSAIFSSALLSHLPPKTPEIESDVKTLHSLFELSAQRSPGRVALEFCSSLSGNAAALRWTYAELEADANGLANVLLHQGVRPNSLVAVCFDKCPEASIALLAILKAGCGFVALDPGAPSARKAFILEDSKADMLLTVAALGADLSKIPNARVMCVDEVNRTEFGTQRPQIADNVVPSATSYCLYTSGSTGKPKGCIIMHENAVQAMLSFSRLFAGRWNDESRWFQFASFHFDVCVVELFWSWSVGICVVSIPRDILFEDLAGSLRKLNITHIDLTPSLARLITPADVPSLCPGVFITGGEPLKQEVLDAWGSQEVIHNGYGPTETTIGVTMYPRVPGNGRPSNIGWQFDNVGTYIFRPGTTDLVPRGAVGELCISGKLVSKGYLNRDDLTAECFPYVEKYGERLYRTRDLVRMLYDGSFDFLGRSDDQVKLRGQRLELGEVNSAIKAGSEGIEEVTTMIMKPSHSQADQLVAFIVPRATEFREKPEGILGPKNEKLINDVRKTCQERLPDYMIPSRLILVNYIPLTVNNKSDAKKLREVFETVSDGYHNKHGSEELSDDERKLANVLTSSVSTSIEAISSGSNIFQLGLDSISVFGFARALTKAGFINAQPATILQSQTIGGLAKALEAKSRRNDSSIRAAKQRIIACGQRYRTIAAKTLKIAASEVESVAPCTPLQLGMIARSLETDQHLYFNTFTFDLIDNIDQESLCNAWNEVQRNVPILRTRFVPSDEGYVQAVVKQSSLPFMRIHQNGDKTIQDVVEQCQKEWRQANNEVVGVPFQVGIISCQNQKLMILNIFHGCYDATALPLLLAKAASVYAGESDTSYGPMFSSVLPYGPLRTVDGAQKFWTEQLEHAEIRPLPSDIQKEVSPDSYATLRITNINNFEECRRDLNITHQALVQVCWMAVLQNFVNGPTTVGTVVSGRSIDFPAETTIGPLFNTLPLWFDFSKNDTWRSAAKRCHEMNMSMLPFHHTALRDVMKWCKTSGQLFDSLFVFQKGNEADTPSPWKPREASIQADYALSFEAEYAPNGDLNLTIVAKGAAADVDACKNLLGEFKTLLGAFLRDSGRKVETDLGDWFQNQQPYRSRIETAVSNSSSCVADDFDWTEQASMIREQIANIADVDVLIIKSTSSLFELGLDSIDAIKLSSKLREKQISISVSEIMRRPNIAQMVEHISTESVMDKQGEDSRELKDISKLLTSYLSENGINLSNASSIMPVTPLQESMLADMYASDFANYYGHDVLLLRPDVDLSRLKDAWNQVISQTSILRSSFVSIGAPEIGCAFAQIEHNSDERQWKEIILDESEAFEHTFQNIRQEISRRGENATLFQLTFVKRAGQDFVILSMPHACYDGWSLGLLHDDVRAAYNESLGPRPRNELALSNILAGKSSDAEEFWQNTMTDVASCLFPMVAKPSATPKVDIKERQSQLSLHKIQDFCKAQNVTLQAIGQLCWSLVLASYVGTLDITFGVVLSGRDTEKAQQILFPTMNTVAARMIIHGSRAEMLTYVQANLADLMRYQHFPLRRVQALAGLQDRGLFNTLFIYQKKPDRTSDGEPLYISVDGSSGVEYPVCVEMELMDRKFIWRTACENRALEEHGVEILLTQLDEVLQRIIEKPDAETIEFNDDRVIVCGLPAFKVHEQGASGNEPTREAVEDSGDASTTDWTETELDVREVLSKISKVPAAEILKRQTLFHLGLDSISAIKVSAMLKKQKNIQISVSAMLHADTIGNIADLAKQQLRPEDVVIREVTSREMLKESLERIDILEIMDNAELSHEDVDNILPASAVQVYFLSTWQNSRGALFYSTFYYRVKDDIDIELLHKHWLDVVEHHPILRTVFVATGDAQTPYLQFVLKHASVAFEDDISDPPRSKPSNTESPLSRSTPVNLKVKKLRNGHFGLDLTIHHALYDGVSLDLLVQELQDRYNGTFAPIATRCCTFTDLLALGASRAAYTSRKKFWTEYLKDANARTSQLLSEAERSTQWTAKRRTAYRPAAVANFPNIERNLCREGVTVQAVFLTIIAAIYASIAQSSNSTATPPTDVVLAVYLANRSHPLPGISTLAAPTLNIVPLRVHSPSATSKESIIAAAKRVQEDLRTISSAERSGVGLWEIAEWTGVKVDLFVNFLRLPGERVGEGNGAEPGTGCDTGETREGGMRIKEVKLQDHGDIGAAEAAEDRRERGAQRDFEVPPAFERSQATSGVFLPSLDIEAAIRDDELDVGVFAPQGLFGEDVVEEVYSGMEGGFGLFL